MIGVVGLGAEGGSWYVTKQHAQNAADAAAYSGGLVLACQNAGQCTDTQSVAYRGKEFAAQNAFCNAGDTSYPGSRCATSLPTGTSQAVQINQLTSWPGVNGNYSFRRLLASNSQRTLQNCLVCPPSTYARKPLPSEFLTEAPMRLGIDRLYRFPRQPEHQCARLRHGLERYGPNALDFTGGGISVNVAFLLAAGGCTGAASFCSTALTYSRRSPIHSLLSMAPSPRCAERTPASPPLAVSRLADLRSSLTRPTHARIITSQHIQYHRKSERGILHLRYSENHRGPPQSQGTAIFILLPGATINNQGNAIINTSAPTTAPSASSLPAALQSDASLLTGMAMFAAPVPAVDAPTALQFGGNTNINLKGNIYAPTAAVTFQGNPTLNLGGGSCGELVAYSVQFNGNATLDDSGCSAAGIATPSANMCSWCNDEKARSAPHCGAGILPWLIVLLRRPGSTY